MRTKGFTLIELLVVIAIIGVLASIVLASLDGARKKGRDARRISDLKQIQLALELFFDTNRAYPATEAILYTTGTGLAPTFIPTVPKDPLNASNYKYTGVLVGSTCASYHLAAILEESTNPALPGVDNTGGGTVCTSGTNFDGTKNGCSASGTGNDTCYDLTP